MIHYLLAPSMILLVLRQTPPRVTGNISVVASCRSSAPSLQKPIDCFLSSDSPPPSPCTSLLRKKQQELLLRKKASYQARKLPSRVYSTPSQTRRESRREREAMHWRICLRVTYILGYSLAASASRREIGARTTAYGILRETRPWGNLCTG